MRSSVELDRDRHRAGFAEDILAFYCKHAMRISNADPRLCFNADETMLSAKRVHKAVTDKDDMHAMACSLPAFQHMPAMVTVCSSGAVVPPMLILSALQNLPPDLQDLKPHAWGGQERKRVDDKTFVYLLHRITGIASSHRLEYVYELKQLYI